MNWMYFYSYLSPVKRKCFKLYRTNFIIQVQQCLKEKQNAKDILILKHASRESEWSRNVVDVTLFLLFFLLPPIIPFF